MGTKANPSKFDCYTNAEQDEPMFILLARDPASPILVEAWAAIRRGDLLEAVHLMNDAVEKMLESKKPFLFSHSEKNREALQCACEMRTWRLVELTAQAKAKQDDEKGE